VEVLLEFQLHLISYHISDSDDVAMFLRREKEEEFQWWHIYQLSMSHKIKYTYKTIE
jgi:hypothetical protein